MPAPTTSTIKIHSIKAAHKLNLLVAVLGGRVGGNALFVVVVVVVLLVPAAVNDLEAPAWDKGVLAFSSHGFRGVAMPVT